MLLHYNKQVQPIKTHQPPCPPNCQRNPYSTTHNELLTHTPTPSNTLPAQHSPHTVLSEYCAMADDIFPRGFRGLSEAIGCIGQGTPQLLRRVFVPNGQE